MGPTETEAYETRIAALKWWDKLEYKKRWELTKENHDGRSASSLTGSEIEKLYKAE